MLVTRFNDGRRGLTQISEVLPLGDDGRYRLQDMFTYQLEPGAEGKAGRGKLVWSAATSSFVDEPKVRILRDQWDLSKEIFNTD